MALKSAANNLTDQDDRIQSLLSIDGACSMLFPVAGISITRISDGPPLSLEHDL